MHTLAEMVRPTAAVYTVIGHAHLEFLHDLDGVLRAKTEMLDLMPEDAPLVMNGDDEKLRGELRWPPERFGRALTLLANQGLISRPGGPKPAGPITSSAGTSGS